MRYHRSYHEVKKLVGQGIVRTSKLCHRVSTRLSHNTWGSIVFPCDKITVVVLTDFYNFLMLFFSFML